jgi:phage terminase small subunit
LPVLANAQHEAFAKELAAGRAAPEAYAAAGYQPNQAAASWLAGRVKARVDEIRAEANQTAAERLAITQERILKEYARIGFADIRKIVDWVGELVTEEERPDGGNVLVVKNTVSNHVRLKSAGRIDDDIAAAIAEVRHSNAGGLTVKLHPKLPALDALAEHLGISKPARTEQAAANGGPSNTHDLTPLEAGRRIAFTLARARYLQAKLTTKEQGPEK